MSKRIQVPGSARNVIGGLVGVLGWLLRFARLMLAPKAVLAAKPLAAESQLAACTDAIERKKAPKPRFTLSFRLLWIALSKWLPGWRKLAHVMQPATVVGRHRRTAKSLWRWKSRPGRPSFHSPWQNACAERFVLTVKSECLWRLLVFDEEGLRHNGGRGSTTRAVSGHAGGIFGRILRARRDSCSG